MERAGKPLIDKTIGKLRALDIHVDRRKLERMDKTTLVKFAEAIERKAGAGNG